MPIRFRVQVAVLACSSEPGPRDTPSSPLPLIALLMRPDPASCPYFSDDLAPPLAVKSPTMSLTLLLPPTPNLKRISECSPGILQHPAAPSCNFFSGNSFLPVPPRYASTNPHPNPNPSCPVTQALCEPRERGRCPGKPCIRARAKEWAGVIRARANQWVGISVGRPVPIRVRAR